MTGLLQFIVDLFKNLPPFAIIQPDEVGVFTRLGKFKRSLGNGFYWKLPILDMIRKTASKEQTIDLANQTIESKVGESYTVSGYLKYRVVDPAKALLEVFDYDVSLPRQAMCEIACIVGTMERPTQARVTEAVTESIDEYAEQWGLEILEFGVVEFTRTITIRLMQQNG